MMNNNNLKNRNRNRTNFKNNMGKKQLNNNVTTKNVNKVSEKEIIDLTFKIRQLCLENVMWTRFFTVSAYAGIGDLKIITKKLINNSADFSNILKKFCNKNESEKLEVLIMDNLLLEIKCINSIKLGNSNSLKEIKKQLYINTEQIAKYLTSGNPNCSEEKFINMFHEKLKLTEEQAIKRSNRQYSEDILLYEKLEALSKNIADLIINEFILKSK